MTARLLERDPARLVDLVVVVGGVARDVVAEEEVHGLADPPARRAGTSSGRRRAARGPSPRRRSPRGPRARRSARAVSPRVAPRPSAARRRVLPAGRDDDHVVRAAHDDAAVGRLGSSGAAWALSRHSPRSAAGSCTVSRPRPCEITPARSSTARKRLADSREEPGELRDVGLRGGDQHVVRRRRPRRAPARRAGRARRRPGSARSGRTGGRAARWPRAAGAPARSRA